MRSISRRLQRTAAALVLIFAAACAPVQYRAEDSAGKSESSLFERTVDFRLDRRFYDDLPRCAFIVPSDLARTHPGKARVVEDAVARHLSHRLERVIGPHRRDRLMRERAIDPTTPQGRKRFAASTRCNAAIEIATAGPDSTFAIVWAQAKLQLSVRLVRTADGTELWRATHTASRSEGTLPLSPVSIPLGAFSAGRLHGDTDVFPSMADDVARRLSVSLPDTRGIFQTQRARQ